MQEATVIITNKTGLHARPANRFVKRAGEYESEIKIIKDGKKVNAKSIMGVMSLGVEKGDEIDLKVVGNDEKKAVEGLVAYLEDVLPEEEEKK